MLLLAVAVLSIVPTCSTTGNRANADETVHAMPVSGAEKLSVMTYNVKGLPWPVASGREDAAHAIAARLAAMRGAGSQPHIVILQEAFGEAADIIAREGGYEFAAKGPIEPDRSDTAPLGTDYAAAARWDRGETVAPMLGSGLAILSDYPIARVRRHGFPAGACAGFDCLAAKGLLVAWIDIPGLARPIAVGDTHLNARGAAGVSLARADRANGWQVADIAGKLAQWIGPDEAAIIGGDWNIGEVPARIAAFGQVTSPDSGLVNDLDRVLDSGAVIDGSQAEADAIHARNKDIILSRGSGEFDLVPARVSVPFGRSTGIVLSDHAGYVIGYAIEPARSDLPTPSDHGAMAAGEKAQTAKRKGISTA